MSHLPFTISAYLFNSISALVDKYLLSDTIKDPLIYIFYFSIFSLIALFLLPFTHVPSLWIFFLASSSTLLWTSGAYFMFRALKLGNVSRVIPVIGTLIPLILLIFALTDNALKINEIWGVIILVIGLVFLTLPDWKGKITRHEIYSELASAILFSVSYIILRQAYLQDDFLTVFAWSRLILIPVGVILVLVPYTHKIVLAKNHHAFKIWSKVGMIFLLGQAAGGVSELLLTYSVHLANPALVNSLQGVQYAFLFIISLILGRKYPQIYHERITRKSVVGKVVGVSLIGFGLYFLAVAALVPKQVSLGVTYSPRYAAQLGLDPKITFSNMLQDLNIHHLRLPVYWSEVEQIEGRYNFSEVDNYLHEAKVRNVQVTLGIGYKMPRWPECFAPEWAKKYTLAEKAPYILNLLEQEVKHFKASGAIVAWQVENESFLSFGECEPRGDQAAELLRKEVELVKSMDTRPVMITDSGELTAWAPAMKLADWFGVSLYRTVWNPWFGLTDYPFAPLLYQFKGQMASVLAGHRPEKMIISELQEEPWATSGLPLQATPLSEQTKNFPVKQLGANLNFAKETGFNEIYLWGVEWWYFMAARQHPEYLDQAKIIFLLNKNPGS